MSSPEPSKNLFVRLWAASHLTFGPFTETKVPPLITIYFWIIKILCTTIGEAFADYLNDTVGLGLPKTTGIMFVVWTVSIFVQAAATKYIPGVYWFVVVTISVFGTLITDNLTDGAGVQVWATVILWAGCLAISFGIWYYFERTLSIHSIYTRRREAFYWNVILFTFALGTGTGDMVAEEAGIGYWESIVLWAGIMALTYIAYCFLRLPAVPAFWIGYVFSRPLGASIGDFLSQKKKDGGLGLGPGITSAIFSGIILVVVIFLHITKKDMGEVKESKNSLSKCLPEPASASDDRKESPQALNGTNAAARYEFHAV